MTKWLSDEELDRVADAISYAVSCVPEEIDNLSDETITAVISQAKEANRLREAARSVIENARPHYDRQRLVPGWAMDRLVEAVEDGGDSEPVSD